MTGTPAAGGPAPIPRRGDTALVVAVIGALAVVQFALTFPDVPVYRDLIKLYLFHLCGWPLAVWAWASGRVRPGAAEAVLGAWLLLDAVTLLWAPYPASAWGPLADHALYLAWFTVVRAAAAAPGGRLRLLAGFYWTGTALAVTGLAHHWVLPLVTDTVREYRMRFPASDPNSFGLVLVPVLGLGCWYLFAALRDGRRGRAVLHALALAAAAAAFVSARSQAAAAGLTVAAAGFILVRLYAGGTPGRRRAVLAVMALLAVLAAAGAGLAYPRLGGTFAVRRLCWAAGADMLVRHPLGSGPGAAAPLLPAFLDPAWHVTDGFGDYVDNLHNEYLEVGAETGFAGLALFGAFLALTLAAYYRDWTGRCWAGAAAGAAVAAMAVEMIAGVSMRLWSAPIVFWTFAALAPPAPSARALPRAVRAAAAGAVALAGAAAFVLTAYSWQAERAFAVGVDVRRPAEARIAALDRARMNPLCMRDAFKAAFFRTSLLLQQADAAEGDPARFDAALAEVRWLNARHGDFAGSRGLEARILLARGDHAAALAAGLAAFRLDPFAGATREIIGQSGAAVAGLAADDTPAAVRDKLGALDRYAGTAAETALLRGLACLWGGHLPRAKEYLAAIPRPGLLADIGDLAAVPRLMDRDANLPALLVVVETHLRKYPGDRDGIDVRAALLRRSATALAAKGQRDEAIFMLDALLEADPADAAARRQRAALLREAGRDREAAEEEARARELEQ